MPPATQHPPIHMEDHFSPGFPTKPAVHIGSQSMRLYHADRQEQAIEALHMAGTSEGDVVVVRNVDPAYIDYWKQLMGDVHIINLQTENSVDFLSNILLNDPKILDEVRARMHPEATLMVYFPTELEDKLAQSLGIKLHGTPSISQLFGTKTGIRALAQEENLAMTEGFICTNKKSIKDSAEILFQKYDEIIIKHDLSSAGRWMKKISKQQEINLDSLIDEISGGRFEEGRDSFVVEGWVDSKASLCAHIEILPDQEPRVSAAWQQIIDEDGVTYIGAGPLRLHPDTMVEFRREVYRLAHALKKHGAIGSFAPDFIITSEHQTQFPPNTPLLIELNGRVPFTAFPLEIVKQVKGTVGSGFMSLSIHLPEKIPFREVHRLLSEAGLLITKKGSTESGVVPFNISQLEWQKLNIVSIGENWEKTEEITERVKLLFHSI